MRKAALRRRLSGASRGTMAALLLAAPTAAAADGFAGGATVVHGQAFFTVGTGPLTIAIPTSSPVTTINWQPTDTAIGGGPIDFLPAANGVNYAGNPGASVPYTVLNRIIANDPTRSIAFNGAVTSSANTRVWFYSPSGLLIGANASFNVGGLVLTTADPVTDANGNFMPSFDRFSVQGAAGGTSAITIQPGASITALNPAQSNYIVAIAPQINQGGSIGVAGSVALVAAESASFAVDSRGLFNISVTAGTTVATNSFVHGGSTGGPNAAPVGGVQRVYMVAVPKNNAVEMAISAGGSLGFAVADAANMDGNQIVLSAGSNIADTGSGNPVVVGRAGSGAAGLTVGGAGFTSNTYAVATDTASITDPAANISFRANLAVIAPQATVNAQFGTISVAGNLTVNADNSLAGATKTALIEAGPGATLAVGGNAAALGVAGSLTESANDALGGVAGSAKLTAPGGTVTVAGNLGVLANGSWANATNNPGGITTLGGSASIAVSSGGTLTVGAALLASATADGTAADSVYQAFGPLDLGVNAIGGTAMVNVTGANSNISAHTLAAYATATGGTDSGFGNGGTATGGTALMSADSGGAMVSTGLGGSILTNAGAAGGSPGLQAIGTGGTATGGSADIIANAGTIAMVGQAALGASAAASGGSAIYGSGSGGAALGGMALIATQGANGTILTNTSGDISAQKGGSAVNASAFGGAAVGGAYAGGSAVAGTATLQVTGAGQAITLDHGTQVSVLAEALGGAGAGAGGGNATGGTARLLADGGALMTTSSTLSMNAGATGGADSSGTGNGGTATGGTVQIAASKGGIVRGQGAGDAALSAFAAGGSSTGGTGGNALGGNILLTLDQAVVNLTGVGDMDTLDTSDVGGTSISGPAGTAGSAGGVLLTTPGTVNIQGTDNLTGNTRLYMQVGGSITVSGAINGTGAGAYLHLWADDLGTGAGTVTLANGALNFPSNQIDIYYNPTSLGTPTDFSAGASAGTVTAYQLVDDINQLQSVGLYSSQNFALGKNIDASATQGWNAGAGFVPIGSPTAPFNGNFDGLDHTITNLYINTPAAYDVGLFGQVSGGTAATIGIRNVGLVNAVVTGNAFVGGLIGLATTNSGCGCAVITVSNSFSDGTVSANEVVGGLVGSLDNNTGALALLNSHSDAAVMASGSSGNFDIGGLAGYAQGTSISNVFATGNVTAMQGGFQEVGGLIGGTSYGTSVFTSLTNAYATGAIQVGVNTNYIGGLVGSAGGKGGIANAYAAGSLTAGAGSSDIGGLVGQNFDPVTGSWASEVVLAPGSSGVGGFVGNNLGVVTDSYWDTYSTGQANGLGANSGSAFLLNPVTSDPAQIGMANYAFNPNAYANFSSTGWVYDNNNTRPVGAWEVPVPQFGVATIASAHQVQLIDYDLGGSYAISQNIDLRGTATTGDIWAPGGFMPLGGSSAGTPFSGTLAGGGHVLSNLTIAVTFDLTNVGLVQQNYGIISGIGLDNAHIAAANSAAVGTIAGVNAGYIINSFATGVVTLTQTSAVSGMAGGLVGLNSAGGLQADGSPLGNGGSIAQSYASVAMSGGAIVGGLAGDNEGAIDGSYANGPVGNGGLTGGLVGESADASGPTVTNSYWDTQLTGQNLGCGFAAVACSGAAGLTTAQTRQSGSFTGFSIDTTGGQGLPWRQYQGQTTPLLATFLTPITVQAGSLTTQYNAGVPNIGVTTYGADPALTFGTPQISGLTRNAGTALLSYIGGLYSNQLGYDFVPSTAPGTLVITPAPLLLAAASDSKVYDATTNSAGVVAVSGLFGSDSVSNATQSFVSANAMGSNASTLVVNSGYAISDGHGGANYTVTLQTAPGTITPAPLAITYTANIATSIYGQAISGLSGVVGAQGLQGNDTLASVASGTASFTTAASGLSNVGSYAITGAGLSGNSGNYSFSFAQAPGNATALTIAAASLLVAADPQNRSYGAANPALTYSETGLVNGDTLTGSLATGATPASNVGSYAITQGSLAASSNYVLSYQGANLAVTPASLTVTYTANPASSIYGTAPTGLSGSASAAGLVNNDTLASVTSGTASFTTAASALSNVGSYAITGAGLSGNSGNYSFSFAQAPGNATALTIAAASLTVAADPQNRSYGAANPALTYSETGLVNGDTLTGSLATGATPASNVGSYAITQGSLAASSNYVLSYQGANLAVTPASLTVTYTANPASSIYGNAPTGLSGSASAAGLVNNDTLASVTSGTASFTTAASALSNVGSYAITGAGLSGNSGNYSFSFAQAPGNATALTIAARPITVIADPQQRLVGAADPVFTYVVSGSSPNSAPALVNGDRLTGQLTSSAAVTSLPGNYPILQGTLVAPANYQLAYVGNFLTIASENAPVVVIGNLVTANLPDQTDSPPEQRKKQEAAVLAAQSAGVGVSPPQIAVSLINDRLVTIPPPIIEAVTSNGNASLWGPKAP